MRRAEAVDVRDVAVVEMRVPLLRLRLRRRRAVTLVAESYFIGCRGRAAQRRVHGLRADVVAMRLVVAIDGGIAEAVVRGDARAAALLLVEHVAHAREVEAEAPLAHDEEVGGGDDRAGDREVGLAREEGAGAGLRAGDEARGLAAREARRRHVGHVELIAAALGLQPQRGIDDSAERALREARGHVALGVVEHVGEVGELVGV